MDPRRWKPARVFIFVRINCCRVLGDFIFLLVTYGEESKQPMSRTQLKNKALARSNRKVADPQPEKRVPVELLQKVGVYNVGEIVGFPKSVADDLVTREVAKKVDGEGNG